MKLFIFIIAMIVMGTYSYSDAIVRDVTGRVETRLSGGEWTAVEVGQTIPLFATISTGFNSFATLELPNSRITIRALTRLTIEELSQQTTEVFVPVGRVRASVDRSDRLSTDFRVRTAQSTAAVRGTEFETNGWELIVINGEVIFYNEFGEYKIVRQGESFSFNEIDEFFIPEITDLQQNNGLITIRFRRQ